jgi:hypothetical protein
MPSSYSFRVSSGKVISLSYFFLRARSKGM